MKLYALIKVAGNPKVKRYWQLLKRLYGDTDDTVKELKKSRDFGIYHGTEKNIAKKKILIEGLKSNQAAERGTGVFFGSKNIAMRYTNKDNLPKLQYNKGSLFRLKYPNELKNKENYPDINKTMNFDGKDKNEIFNSIQFGKDRLLYKIIEKNHDKMLKTVTSKKENIRKKFNRPETIAGTEYNRFDAMDDVKKKIIEKYLKKQDFNKFKYNGIFNINKKNIKLDHYINAPERNEFLIKDNIPSNLIKNVSRK